MDYALLTVHWMRAIREFPPITGFHVVLVPTVPGCPEAEIVRFPVVVMIMQCRSREFM